MRILFVGPPLYGLLYPVLSLAQAFRVNGHEVLIASGGQFAQKAAEKLGWWYLTLRLVSIRKRVIAVRRHYEKKITLEQKWGTSHSSAKK